MTYIKYIVGVGLGLLANALGGFDLAIQTLLGLVVLDYLTGLLNAGYNGCLSTEIGFRGICRKVAMFFAIALSVLIENVMGNTAPIREVVIMFFVVNESLSIIENLGEIIELPSALEKAIKSLKGSE